MAFKYPSDGWMKEMKRICDNDQVFKEAVGSFSGTFVFQLEPDDKLKNRTFLFMKIGKNGLHEAGQLSSIDDFPGVDYILEGSYTTWREVVTGKREPLRAIMTRKLKLTKGKQLALLKNTKMAMRLINNSVQVPTEPD